MFFFLPQSVETQGGPILAEATYCFCSANMEKLTLENYKDAEGSSICTPVDSKDQCTPENFDKTTDMYLCYTMDQSTCNAQKDLWDEQFRTKYNPISEYHQQFDSSKDAGAILPPCVLEDTLTPECRDISIFVITLINLGRWLFGIIGAIALVMFIYGGFVMILSRGNSEQVKKGTGAMVAAVTGLVIAFGAYILIGFLAETIGVQSGFRL